MVWKTESRRRQYDLPPGPNTVCYCLSTDTDDVLGCDTCDQWYHPECLELTPSQLYHVTRVEVWRCPECVKLADDEDDTEEGEVQSNEMNSLPLALDEASNSSIVTVRDKNKNPPVDDLNPSPKLAKIINFKSQPLNTKESDSKCKTCSVLQEEVQCQYETIDDLKKKIRLLKRKLKSRRAGSS